MIEFYTTHCYFSHVTGFPICHIGFPVKLVPNFRILLHESLLRIGSYESSGQLCLPVVEIHSYSQLLLYGICKLFIFHPTPVREMSPVCFLVVQYNFL
jgi:hypothetical protein